MISEQQWLIYEQGRARGLNQVQAARLASISVSSARAHDTKAGDAGKYRKAQRGLRAQPDPRRPHQLGEDARLALEDFDLFCLRYLGLVAVPWQREAAEEVRRYVESPDKEFVVINAPPGAGKSTIFTYAIPLWLICRDRAIRILIGSATAKLAGQYVARIRRALEATLPIQADDEDKLKGVAVDALATLAEDYGRFKPIDAETWTRDAFIVQQYDGAAITSKEPTVTAVGRDQEFIGGRYDVCLWDDLVTSNRLRSLETIEKDRDWWDTYAERRLEPAGLLVLQGQRMAANDLYRYCLDMVVTGDEDDDEDTIELREGDDGEARKYHHVIFKAHYEERCLGAATHRRDSPPYPEGCLISPRRITWREVASMEKNRPDTFAQVYQQEDISSGAALVDMAWVAGTGGFPGCWDADRAMAHVPKNLSYPTFSVVAADPSPTKYWGILWLLYNLPSDTWYVVDLARQKMEAPDFLDWRNDEGIFVGLMEEWQQRSVDLGAPITHWIVEIAAAQRFLLQYEHVRRWQSKHGVQIMPHSTGLNKLDGDFGVQMLAPIFRDGRIRLPGTTADHWSRVKSLKLVDEVTRYSTHSSTRSNTTDLVMALWFATFQMQYIGVPSPEPVRQRRPSWIGSSRRSRQVA